MDIDVILVDDGPDNLDQMQRILVRKTDVPFEDETIHSTFHTLGPVLDRSRNLDLDATLEKIENLVPGVAIVDMRLEGDDPHDYSGLKLATCIKERYDTCCIILVSTFLPSISDFVKYLEIFHYRVDRSKPAEDYQQQLRDSFTKAVKTHVSTRKYLEMSQFWPPRPDHENVPSVYISYARRAEGNSMRMVSRMNDSLRKGGYEVRMDTKDVGYTKSLSEYMSRLARSICVVVVISDLYLRSPFCMAELLEIYNNHNFQKRVVPIVLEDADIESAADRIAYVKHWNNEVKQLEGYVSKTGILPLLGGQTLRDLENCRDIGQNIDRLLSFIMDMNFMTPEEIEADDFKLLKGAIDNCMSNP